MKDNNKSVKIDRIIFFIAMPGTLLFIYYLIIDKYSYNLDNLLGTQINQHRSELKALMDGNFLLVIFNLLSSLVFLISILVFVLKKIFFFKQKTIESVQTKITASDWIYAILGTIAPYLVCLAIHAYSQSIYRAGEGSENFEKLQERGSILIWSVITTLIVGYIFALKFWLKHPSYKSKNFLLVIYTTIQLTGLFFFNLGVYLFFGGPF